MLMDAKVPKTPESSLANDGMENTDQLMWLENVGAPFGHAITLHRLIDHRIMTMLWCFDLQTEAVTSPVSAIRPRNKGSDMPEDNSRRLALTITLLLWPHVAHWLCG